jgi:predicted phage-related endonuclease
MFASLDRVVAGKKIVELKNARTAEGWGRTGTDEVPEHYMIQVQHQLHVGIAHGLEDKADVAVLIGGCDLRIYQVSYLPHFAEALEQQLCYFWEKVRQRVTPEFTFQDRPELLALLYRPRAGTKILLDEAARALTNEYQQLGVDLAALEHKRQTLKTQLIQRLGEASEGHLGDGRVIRRRQITRREYRVPETTFFSFTILKGGHEET